MAIYYTLGTRDAAPIDGAPRWNGRDKVRDDFNDRVREARQGVASDLGDVHLIQVEGRLHGGPIR